MVCNLWSYCTVDTNDVSLQNSSKMLFIWQWKCSRILHQLDFSQEPIRLGLSINSTQRHILYLIISGHFLFLCDCSSTTKSDWSIQQELRLWILQKVIKCSNNWSNELLMQVNSWRNIIGTISTTVTIILSLYSH